MAEWLKILLTIAGSVAASSGFWAWVQSRRERNDAKSKMLLGLGHDRICYLSMCYIDRGWVSKDEFENLVDYLYKPYQQMGGNGTALRLIEAVKRLPVHNITYLQMAEQKSKQGSEATGKAGEPWY